MWYFIAAVAGLLILYWWLRYIINRLSEVIKDRAAHDALKNLDLEKEKTEIKSIGKKYISKDYICPRCNDVLLIRNGKYGKFLGCNSYPNCKYTRDIKDELLR